MHRELFAVRLRANENSDGQRVDVISSLDLVWIARKGIYSGLFNAATRMSCWSNTAARKSGIR